MVYFYYCNYTKLIDFINFINTSCNLGFDKMVVDNNENI